MASIHWKIWPGSVAGWSRLALCQSRWTQLGVSGFVFGAIFELALEIEHSALQA